MRKIVLVMIIALLLVSPSVSAINLEVKQTTDDVAMIIGLGMPAMFELDITNKGGGDYFMFYNFFGSGTLPKGTVLIGGGETKNVDVGVYPRDDMRQEGWFKFDLYIKGAGEEEQTVPLMVNVVKLDNAFEIGVEEFKPNSSTVMVYVKNLVNFNFNSLSAKFSSQFFNLEKSFTLLPHEKKSFEVNVDKEKFKDLMAGFYTLKAEIIANDKKANVEGTIRYAEENIVTSSQNEYGLIVYTKKIIKENEGNVFADSSTVIKKNIISRLFTSFSPEPEIVERQGFSVYYTWERALNPGEKLEIVVRTNWLLPLLAILLIVAIVILAKQFSRTSLSLKKRVSFVNAKGGEFALRVSMTVTARKYVQKINIIERLPMLVKLHEKFGGEMPRRVDEKNRRIEWHFDKMQPGESRIISYIIYSKVGVLGKFALPVATAIYEKDGEVHEAVSNHAFFIAEQGKKIED
ncbi:MAG: hypothetical protein PHQ66_02210 [Candidatus Nanoarchaeia archaeon]|nr:hypothetical protein [Candidatus Nanoarchaeia archaeon]MDD5357816.1 hypothetical protein [Candidatus Nanoarchaeia archaeon]MDD5588735.1 hypothetical protein [Candidatus Nanoarchaeia archaeon]